jgi:DNA-binding helix-hairpin-helix protein with protein kinase domain
MADWLGSLSGRSVRMACTGSEVTVGRRIGAGGQGDVYEAALGSRPVALKWLRPNSRTADQRRTIEALIAAGQPHRAFTWPIDIVEALGWPGFGYLMPLLDTGRFKSFAAMLNDPQQPPFRALITISRELVDAFAALHSSGVCYRDINFGNLQVDPVGAEVAIIDIDNVGVDGGAVFVKGTPRFMAPEIVRGDALPSTVTDLYSLAVFLFHIFMHGHPLEGSRTDSSYNWSEGHVSESDLAVLHYGTEPVFVFDSNDASNRPVPGDPVVTWWGIYPRFLRDVFHRAFTTGISDASLSGRVLEGVWRRVLARLADCVSVCPSCRASLFWDPDDPTVACWNCRRVPSQPALLELPGHQVVVLADGAVVTSRHLSEDRDYRKVMAAVEPHPSRPGAIVVRNLSGRGWKVVPDGEGPKTVGPDQRLGVRPMVIDFGPVRGRIVGPGEIVGRGRARRA